MARNRNQQNYLRIFAAQPAEKKCQLPSLGNHRTSTSCHSATMPILAMHLIGRCNWNRKCYGKWCARRILVTLSQKVERYFSLLILFINGQNMVSNDVNWCKTDFWPPNHCPSFFPSMSPLFPQMSPLFQEPWDIVPSYKISRQNTGVYYKVSGKYHKVMKHKI